MDKNNPFVDQSVLLRYTVYLPVLNKTLDFTYGSEYASLFLDMIPYDMDDAFLVACECLNSSEALSLLFCIGKMICLDPSVDDEFIEDYFDVLNRTLENCDDSYDWSYFDVQVRMPSGKLLETFIEDKEIIITVDGNEEDKDVLLVLLNASDDLEFLSIVSHICTRICDLVDDEEYEKNAVRLLQSINERIEYNS